MASWRKTLEILQTFQWQIAKSPSSDVKHKVIELFNKKKKKVWFPAYNFKHWNLGENHLVLRTKVTEITSFEVKESVDGHFRYPFSEFCVLFIKIFTKMLWCFEGPKWHFDDETSIIWFGQLKFLYILMLIV